MRWWNRESSRQLLPMPAVLLSLLVPGDVIVKVLAAWDIYAIGYLVLTWLAVRRRELPELREVVRGAQRERSPFVHMLTSSPDELSQGAAGFAMVATVIAMPQARTLGTSPSLVLAICIVAVACSWVTLHTGFVIGYLSTYLDKGGLEFPGDDELGLIDFAYFALSIGTTFGTTDVTVTSRVMRRRVLIHGVLAFFFNTLILAVAVTIVTTYIASS